MTEESAELIITPGLRA